MKTQNRFLKRMVLASMVVAFVTNNTQAMDMQNNVDVVVVLEQQNTPAGPARQKYNNFHKRVNQIDPCITAMVRGGTAAFVAGCMSATAGALVGNKDAINVGAFLAVVGYLGVALGLNTDIWREIYSDHLYSKVKAEENQATQAC